MENETIDFVWQICENLNLCVNDSSERPLSNRGRFIAVCVMRVEIFNYYSIWIKKFGIKNQFLITNFLVKNIWKLKFMCKW